MSDLISTVIKGIKCDNPLCGWSDMGAQFEPEFWLNRPCPNCSANLFTQKDYDFIKRLEKGSMILNRLAKPFSFLWKNNKPTHVKIELNGTRKAKARVIDDK